jgi:hypothetical protein
VGIVFVTGCGIPPATSLAPQPVSYAQPTYAQPVYVPPLFQPIDPAPFMNQPSGITRCQPVYGSIQCQSY